jgi:hypothetical protein
MVKPLPAQLPLYALLGLTAPLQPVRTSWPFTMSKVVRKLPAHFGPPVTVSLVEGIGTCRNDEPYARTARAVPVF